MRFFTEKNGIKVGMFVRWKHRVSESWKSFDDFTAEGKVDRIFISSLGGKRNMKYVARIILMPNPYFEKIGRRTTVISLEKLTPIN